MKGKTVKTKPVVISVCGKGGVGKTSISALIVKSLIRNPELRVLAIDADPAIGLAVSLGVSVSKTIDDIRNAVVDAMAKKAFSDKEEVMPFIDYEVFDAIAEADNLAFLAVGRPEKEGCFCKVNTALREVIREVSGSFDFVVIDGEAGVEQVNRRVMERVSHMILVSDLSQKSLRVCQTIDEVAKKAVQYDRAGLIFNRVRTRDDLAVLKPPPGVDVIGALPESEKILEFDRAGRNMLEMSDSVLEDAIGKCLQTLLAIRPEDS